MLFRFVGSPVVDKNGLLRSPHYNLEFENIQEASDFLQHSGVINSIEKGMAFKPVACMVEDENVWELIQGNA